MLLIDKGGLFFNSFGFGCVDVWQDLFVFFFIQNENYFRLFFFFVIGGPTTIVPTTPRNCPSSE
jgi:hypothetical protein